MMAKKHLKYIVLAGLAVVSITIYFMNTISIQSNNTTSAEQIASDIETITIISERYMFSPMLIPLKKGKTIKLVLKTVDVQHGISLPELGINLLAYPGKPAESIVIPEKEACPFFTSFHCYIRHSFCNA